MVPAGGEGHRLLGAAAALGFVVAVDLANPDEYPAAGSTTQIEALLLQSSVCPEGSDLWILCEFPDLLDRREGHLPHPGGPSVGLVLEPLRAFLLEPLQYLVDGGAPDAEIACYGLRAPAVHAQLHDGPSPFTGAHLVVAGIVPL